MKVLNCSMNNILAIVPPKLGDGELTITIANREPVRTIEKFTYSFSAVVTTLAGSANGEPGIRMELEVRHCFSLTLPKQSRLKTGRKVLFA